ncbi:MAG: MFS transporter [Candidatus Hermodarchaeota archaeon]
MTEKPTKGIGPKLSLFSATIVHCSVEIPFFIFPVVLLLVGKDLFPVESALTWIGLGALGTVGTLAAGLPSPFFGKLADKYRRSTLMFVSLILAASGSLGVGLFGESFVVMFVCVILMGLGLALYHPAGLSWISTIFEDPKTHAFSNKYVRILALHGIGGSTGASIGPLSVYFLINTTGWRSIYLYWSFPLILLAVLFWILIGRFEQSVDCSEFSPSEENIPIKKENNKIISNWSQYSVIILIFSFITVMSLTRGMVNFILSPFLSEVKNIEIATAALFIGLSTLIGSTAQILGGFFGDKYGERLMLQISAFLQIFALVGIFIIFVKEVIFLLYVLLGMINALFWPSTNSLVAKNSRTERGKAFGWVMLVANLIGALGPSIDGFLRGIDPNQYLLIFGFSIVFSLCGFIFLIFLNTSSTKNTTKNFI